MSVTDEEKRRLRRRLRQVMEELQPQARQESDRALFTRFIGLPQVAQASTIFAFWGIPPREPETGLLVQLLVRGGKQVALPRMVGPGQMETRLYCPERPLISAAFGILEPGKDCPLVAREEIDLVLVPGLCYDRKGYRLGFGGGYYDRWLKDYSGVRIGLCRQALLQACLPVAPHDIPVDLVVTEGECLSVSGT